MRSNDNNFTTIENNNNNSNKNCYTLNKFGNINNIFFDYAAGKAR